MIFVMRKGLMAQIMTQASVMVPPPKSNSVIPTPMSLLTCSL